MSFGYSVITTPEREIDGYIYCGKCQTKLMLVSAHGEWKVDSEPFKDGEEKPEDCPDEVFPGEVTGHYCVTCEVLTSLTYNHF